MKLEIGKNYLHECEWKGMIYKVKIIILIRPKDLHEDLTNQYLGYGISEFKTNHHFNLYWIKEDGSSCTHMGANIIITPFITREWNDDIDEIGAHDKEREMREF